MRAGGRRRCCPSWRARPARRRSTSPSDVSPFATARDARVDAAPGRDGRRHPGNFVADVGRPAPRTANRTPSSARSGARWERLPRREVHGAPRALSVPPGLAAGRLPAAPDPEAAEPFAPGEDAARERAGALARRRHRRLRRAPRPAGGRHVGALALPALRLRCPRARPSSGRATQGGAGAAAFVRQLAWRDFYAHVLRTTPGNARHALQARLRRARVGRRRRGLRRLVRGPDRLPGRRRRHAPAAPPRLDAQPRAADRRARSSPRTCTSTGGAARRTSCATCSCGDEAQNNGNWQWITSVGVDPAPYFRRLTTRPRSRSATTPTAPTCAAGAPSCATCRSRSWPSRGR